MDWSLMTGYYNAAVRWALPAAAILILIFCIKMLFLKRQPQNPIAVLTAQDGSRYPVVSCESTIGRNALCDIHLTSAVISRRHAVLTYHKGWFISDGRSKSGVFLNGERVTNRTELNYGDVITIGDTFLKLEPPAITDMEQIGQGKLKNFSAMPALFFLNFFQLLAFLSIIFHYIEELPWSILVCFGGLLITEWIYFGVKKCKNIGIEILAFFLITIGLCVAASATPSSLLKQFIAVLLGLGSFCVLEWIMQDIRRTMRLRYAVAAIGLVLLAANLLIGESRYGAKNWINLGFVTIQPSEFVKVAFLFAGCATLERLTTWRNTLLFAGFSVACLGALFLMRDYGTAAIFFVGIVIISYMRSGDWKVIAGFSGLAVLAIPVIILYHPYIASRFSSYLRAWDFASTKGYQQTRTMIAIGSGGLLGVGGGNGNLDRVAASDTDLVFGIVSEEWGLLVALCCAACLLIFAAWAIRCAPRACSAYYSIAACAAGGMFLFQAALNIFGSTDLLPLTGVTFPFISNGGSSMVASFAMLAFFKAAGYTNSEPPKRYTAIKTERV